MKNATLDAPLGQGGEQAFTASAMTVPVQWVAAGGVQPRSTHHALGNPATQDRNVQKKVKAAV